MMLSLLGRDAYRESQVQRLNQVRMVFLANAMIGGELQAEEVDWARRLGPDDTWEGIRSIRHDALAEFVEVSIELRCGDGYGAGHDVPGTIEYLALYADWGDGEGLTTAGLIGLTVDDDDRRAANSVSPRRFRVRLDLPPPRRGACPQELRAILSWHEPPPRNAPDFRPVFGGIMECAAGYQAGGSGLLR